MVLSEAIAMEWSLEFREVNLGPHPRTVLTATKKKCLIHILGIIYYTWNEAQLF